MNFKVPLFAVVVLGLALLTGCATPSLRPAHLDETVQGTGGGLALTWTTGAAGSSYLVESAEILSVYDGDTFFIRVPECEKVLPALCARVGVRLDGIDTPERRGQCAAESAAALQARAYLVRMLNSGEPVVLAGVRAEKYGRMLARVMVGGDDVALGLVAQGLARPYDGGRRRSWCNEKAR